MCFAECNGTSPVNSAYTMTGIGVSHGSTRHIYCSRGYVANSSVAHDMIVCRNGTWESKMLVCTPPTNSGHGAGDPNSDKMQWKYSESMWIIVLVIVIALLWILYRGYVLIWKRYRRYVLMCRKKREMYQSQSNELDVNELEVE